MLKLIKKLFSACLTLFINKDSQNYSFHQTMAQNAPVKKRPNRYKKNTSTSSQLLDEMAEFESLPLNHIPSLDYAKWVSFSRDTKEEIKALLNNIDFHYKITSKHDIILLHLDTWEIGLIRRIECECRDLTLNMQNLIRQRIKNYLESNFDSLEQAYKKTGITSYDYSFFLATADNVKLGFISFEIIRLLVCYGLSLEWILYGTGHRHETRKAPIKYFKKDTSLEKYACKKCGLAWKPKPKTSDPCKELKFSY